MKALVIKQGTNDTLAFMDKVKPGVSDGMALIKMHAAALNHRDQWIREGKYPGIKEGVTLGSDGCGVVESVGMGVSNDWIGKDVIINPNLNWGGNPEVQSADYSVLGMPGNGTLAEYMLVSADRLIEKPGHLDNDKAAALPLAGLTAYRALVRKAEVKSGQNVLITGIGGGVALQALQFATALNAQVYVTSGSDEKIQKAISIGAKTGFNYHDENWTKEASEVGGFDTIIDSSGGDNINQYIKLMKPGGRIVIYGATTGMPSNLDVFRIFWMQVSIIGSTMGNDEEFAEMVEFVERVKMEPVVDSVRPFTEAISAFEKMKAGNQVGKLVVKF
ncbi:MAG: zinc-binding dehydrogenase [Cyclobacteriaceae bacterium]